ncbi:hypothetical protein HON52_04200 [Candidatus Uhrbacteria bacterium]|jgi:hypothetical protein|nr:hypothetical protein [Candidatus Uhrbacteria bacterium]
MLKTITNILALLALIIAGAGAYISQLQLKNESESACGVTEYGIGIAFEQERGFYLVVDYDTYDRDYSEYRYDAYDREYFDYRDGAYIQIPDGHHPNGPVEPIFVPSTGGYDQLEDDVDDVIDHLVDVTRSRCKEIRKKYHGYIKTCDLEDRDYFAIYEGIEMD